MGSPVRVLHVVVNMNRGGAETLLMNLYRNIDRSKVQFDFLTCKEGVFDSEIVSMGGKVHRIPYVTEAGHRGFIKALKQFLMENNHYKIVHSHTDKMSGIVLRTAKKANVPIRIAHSHNTESEGGLLARTYKWYAGSQLKTSATHLFACSNAAAKWLFGSRLDTTTILKNGIEIDKFQFCPASRKAIRNELQLEKDSIVIGHVGRFSHQKNHLFLLDVFAGVVNALPGSVLLLAGDGPLKQTIEKKVHELGLENNVKLLGIRDDVDQLLQAFDLFAFPSFHEGLPVTLVEAQGAGLPCLISDTITGEVDMGLGLIKRLPLTDRNRWIEAALNLATAAKPSRVIARGALAHRGYDIKKTAVHAQHSYLSFGENAI